ncbi:MAG: SDR family oxidoreductase [Planctomycetota bacterium]
MEVNQSSTTETDSPLEGKRALVLGASRGIGAAIVRRLASDGADVTFTFANAREAADTLAQETGSTPKQVDSTNRDALIEAVASEGDLDILVVSAGKAVWGDPLELDPDEVQGSFDLNINAVYFAIAEAGRRMKTGGRVVVIGSTSGQRVQFGGQTAYAAAKAAVDGMARGFARDFGDREITVNVVAPGPTDTEANPADSGQAEMLRQLMTIKRYGKPAEIAGAVSYLTGPEASFITGTTLMIDGGFGL